MRDILDAIDVQLSNLQVDPGDVIVLKVDQELSATQRAAIQFELAPQLFRLAKEQGCKILVLDKGMSLHAVKSENLHSADFTADQVAAHAAKA